MGQPVVETEAETLHRVIELLAAVPGPSPWDWRAYPPIETGGGGRYIWSCPDVGKLSVVVPASAKTPREPIVALNMYCRPFAIPQMLGFWFPSDGEVDLRCFRPEHMQSFMLGVLTTEILSYKAPNYFAVSEPAARSRIAKNLVEGTHEFEFPPAFDALEELLIVSDYTGDGVSEYAIFELHPLSGTVTVRPQKWFTKENFDIGYEWITKVVRDSTTGKIFGSGVRVGTFELTDDECHLERWLYSGQQLGKFGHGLTFQKRRTGMP